jgi:hypothetical protein
MKILKILYALDIGRLELTIFTSNNKTMTNSIVMNKLYNYGDNGIYQKTWSKSLLVGKK